jgi:hypothetical protein
MNEQDEALNFKLKVYQDNRTFFFEAIKQLEYKAYINLTLSLVFLGLVINYINKIEIDYPLQRIKIAGIYLTLLFIVLSLGIIICSIYSMKLYDLKKFLSYDFITLETINNPLSLKENLFKEISGKIKGMVDIYNSKNKYLGLSTILFLLELGIIMGMIIYFFIQTKNI